MHRALDATDREAILANLFPPIAAGAVSKPGFPWHRDKTGRATAGRPQSSQALAVSVLETVASLESKDRVLDTWARSIGLVAEAPWTLTLERLVPTALLGEPRSTQVDCSAESTRSLILFECKFTERDGGGCSQVNRLSSGRHAGMIQCDGAYRSQVNPVNGIRASCALSGKQIRYWDWIPSVLDISADTDHEPCPFRGGWFQWMRNLVACAALADGRSAAVVILYADGPFPVPTELRSDNWKRFRALAGSGRVPVHGLSYQQILEAATSVTEGADREMVLMLRDWLRRRIDEVAARPIGREAATTALREPLS